MIGVTLPGSYSIVYAQPIFCDEVSNNRIAFSDLLSVVDNVGQLATRCWRSVEDVLMCEDHTGQSEKRKYFEAVAVVISHA